MTVLTPIFVINLLTMQITCKRHILVINMLPIQFSYSCDTSITYLLHKYIQCVMTEMRLLPGPPASACADSSSVASPAVSSAEATSPTAPAVAPTRHEVSSDAPACRQDMCVNVCA